MRNYEDIVRRSVKRDFEGASFKRFPRERKEARPKNVRRVLEVSDNCYYAKFRKYFIGKLVRIISGGMATYWVEFMFDADREKLNAAAGWSNAKNRYYLDGVKFDD